MPDRRHPYFAYGSNLCAHQMASRCPDAGAPRPAVLSDHNWLINQRGVATVEPFAGNKVHGVLWQLSSATWSGWTAPKACRCATGANG